MKAFPPVLLQGYQSFPADFPRACCQKVAEFLGFNKQHKTGQNRPYRSGGRQ